MNQPDNKELDTIFATFRDLAAAGKEREAREYLNAEFFRLPKDMQDKLTAFMIVDSLQSEIADAEFKAEIQEEGLAAAEILEKAKKEATE